MPCDEHVGRLIDFVRGWNRAKPMVVHCYAGISRSTAGAFVAACALNPGRDELAIARDLRRAVGDRDAQHPHRVARRPHARPQRPHGGGDRIDRPRRDGLRGRAVPARSGIALQRSGHAQTPRIRGYDTGWSSLADLTFLPSAARSMEDAVMPTTRRRLEGLALLIVVIGAITLVSTHAQQPAPATKVTSLMKQVLAELPGREVVVVTLDIPPGGGYAAASPSRPSHLWLRAGRHLQAQARPGPREQSSPKARPSMRRPANCTRSRRMPARPSPPRCSPSSWPRAASRSPFRNNGRPTPTLPLTAAMS